MSTDIFYFTGTGNSLFIARQLGVLLADRVSIHAIVDFKEQKKVKIDVERVIIVYPVYFQTIPHIVKLFLKKLEFGATPINIYGVATCNGGPGHSLFTTDRILKKKGQSLKAGFIVKMPGNSLIIRDYTNPPVIREKRLEESYHKTKDIYEYINIKNFGSIEGNNSFRYYLQGLITGSVAKYIYKTPSKFRTTKDCTKCRTCIRVCPSDNIKIGKQGVEWGHKCEHCLACYHWCPNMAVEIGNTTLGKLRYHHPDISIDDINKYSRQ